jgi:hypothetical protein
MRSPVERTISFLTFGASTSKSRRIRAPTPSPSRVI